MSPRQRRAAVMENITNKMRDGSPVPRKRPFKKKRADTLSLSLSQENSFPVVSRRTSCPNAMEDVSNTSSQRDGPGLQTSEDTDSSMVVASAPFRKKRQITSKTLKDTSYFSTSFDESLASNSSLPSLTAPDFKKPFRASKRQAERTMAEVSFERANGRGQETSEDTENSMVAAPAPFRKKRQLASKTLKDTSYFSTSLNESLASNSSVHSPTASEFKKPFGASKRRAERTMADVSYERGNEDTTSNASADQTQVQPRFPSKGIPFGRDRGSRDSPLSSISFEDTFEVTQSSDKMESSHVESEDAKSGSSSSVGENNTSENYTQNDESMSSPEEEAESSKANIDSSAVRPAPFNRSSNNSLKDTLPETSLWLSQPRMDSPVAEHASAEPERDASFTRKAPFTEACNSRSETLKETSLAFSQSQNEFLPMEENEITDRDADNSSTLRETPFQRASNCTTLKERVQENNDYNPARCSTPRSQRPTGDLSLPSPGGTLYASHLTADSLSSSPLAPSTPRGRQAMSQAAIRKGLFWRNQQKSNITLDSICYEETMGASCEHEDSSEKEESKSDSSSSDEEESRPETEKSSEEEESTTGEKSAIEPECSTRQSMAELSSVDDVNIIKQVTCDSFEASAMDQSLSLNEASFLECSEYNRTVRPAELPPMRSGPLVDPSEPGDRMKLRIQQVMERAKKNVALKRAYWNEAAAAMPPPRLPPRPPRQAQPGEKKVRYPTPKLFKPGKWANKRLYNFLASQLRGQFGIGCNLEAEKVVRLLNDTMKVVLRNSSYQKKPVERLKLELATLRIIETTYDFYKFVRDFLPKEFEYKVIPCVQPFTNHVWPPKHGNKREDEPIV